MKHLFFSITMLTLLTMSCSQGKKNQVVTEEPERIEPVRIIILDIQSIYRTVEYPATLLAFEEIHLAPAAPGRIEEIYVEIGSRIAKGDVVVQMDRTQLHQAEVQLRTLQTDFNRLDTLRKVGSIPQQQYDQLKAQLEIAQKNVAFLSENTRLHAPLSGVISGKYFEPGEMYSGAPVPTIGKAAIVSLAQFDKLKLMVPVSEKYYPLLKTGQVVGITLDTYPDRTYEGKVFRIHPTIDPTSRTFNVEVAVENRGEEFKPGMFGRVSFDLDKFEALVVPANAVLKMQGSNDRYLFVEKNGKARRISVVPGKRHNDLIEVVSNELKHGDHIIISGQARLLDGMRVKIVE